tara:strand:- start:177220 stop:177888 length:669 start_codon:yes stop_codon:yes gene_type:complete
MKSSCIIVLAAIFTLASSLAGAAEWLQVRNPSTDEWQPAADGSEISFSTSNMLEFEYRLVRERPEDRGPGAILIQVVRKYEPDSGIISAMRERTYLTRNKFPRSQPLPNGDVYRPLYDRFHLNEVGNSFLRNEFHTVITEADRTDAPTPRRNSFIFNDNYEGQTIHRAYLFHYKGVGDGETLIPFNVGVANAFERLRITVIELNTPIGVGLVPRSVEIVKGS